MITQKDIIYFILTDRFFDGNEANNFDVDASNPNAYHGGDFEGIIKRIPYFKKLGITALWVSPIFENTCMPEFNSWGYHGYWPLNFEKVDAHLYALQDGVPEGSLNYFKQLVDELHKNDIKVILDMVTNHLGYNHPVLSEAAASAESGGETPIKREWLNEEGDNSEQKMRLMGLPDLNHGDIEVSDYFVNVILNIIEQTGVDAIRFDAVKNVESILWQHLKTYVKGKYPHVTFIGEVLDFDVAKTSEYQNYFDFDAVFDFPLKKALADAVIYDGCMDQVISGSGLSNGSSGGVLNSDFKYRNHNRLVTFMDNHDMPQRFMNEAIAKYSGDKAGALKVLKLAVTCLFTLRGIPQIYYGSEIAMEGGADPDNRRDMPWNIFDRNMEPSEEHPIEREAFFHFLKLIGLRKENEALLYGPVITLYSDCFIFVYMRIFKDNVAIVAIHNGQDGMSGPVAVDLGNNTNVTPRIKQLLEGKEMKDSIGDSPDIAVRDGRIEMKLDRKTGAVYIWGGNK